MLKRVLLHSDLLAAGAALAVVVASVIWGVLTRYLFSQPATWTTELSAIAFAWMVFFGGSAVMRRGMLISIPLLVEVFPPAVRRVIAVVMAVLVLTFLAYTTYLASVLAVQAGNRPSPVLRISFFYVYAGIALALAMMTVHALVQLVQTWTGSADPQTDTGRILP